MTAWTAIGSIRGPAGPPGSGAAYVHTQESPAATWTVVHALARVPHSVAVYIGGELVFTDVHVTETYAYIEFPSPVAGEVHIL